MVSTLAQAQFFDMLKDKATKAIQDQLNSKPAPPPAAPPAASATPSASSAPASSGAAPQPAGPVTLQAYQGYDFVPGDTIVFEDHFDTDEDGEFPAHWDQLDAQGAINAVGGIRGLALTSPGFTQVRPAIKPQQYLSDSWTAEFDSFPTADAPLIRVFLYSQPTDVTKWRSEVASLRIGENGELDVIRPNQQDLRQDFPDVLKKDGYFGHWHHIAVAFKKGRLKIYMDQYRLYSLQNVGGSPKLLTFGRESAQGGHPTVIANVRIANGADIKIVDKKFTDAKIVTHGINFDNDKATIKPESMGTLNMVVDVLKNNPDIRFSIQGHTDSSGNAAHNLTLSQQRADGVKQQLVELGVDASRLSTKGLGDTAPIADNATLEGRANNRRVEFVTQR